MTTNTGFFITFFDRERDWMLNNHLIDIIRDTGVEISGNKCNITPGFQKAFTDTSNIPLEKIK